MQTHVTNQSGRWTFAALAAVVLMFAGFAAILWMAGLFDFSGTEANAKIVAAALALVGAFIGSAVSIVGLVLKHSIDQRNADLTEQAERRLQIDSEHNAALQRDAEERLKLEAAIQAVKLFSTTTGDPVPMIQRSGALFALASLGLYELTVALTERLLATDQLDASSAAQLLNRALMSGDSNVQHDAINVLRNHVEQFLTPGGIEFPRCILDWDRDLSDYVREWAVVVLGSIMAARPVSGWVKNKFEAFSILAALGLGWTEESHERIKNDIGAVLNILLRPFPDIGQLFHPRKTIDMEQIRSEVASRSSPTYATEELVARLDTWVVSVDRQSDRKPKQN